MGTLEPRKNTGALVRAFDILKQDPVFRDLQLVIAGRPGWLYDDILRQIHNSPFREDIRFLGRVRTSDRVLLYNAASLFVYPSFFEGFGFPPLEAQACGIPVIASNRTSLPEILGDSAVLIDPWRIDELASAMREVLESPSASKKLVQLGLRNAERFDWEEAAKKTLKVFGNVRT
jgi:glycosyltransferase involved in cell wall biosynthesis